MYLPWISLLFHLKAFSSTAQVLSSIYPCHLHHAMCLSTILSFVKVLKSLETISFCGLARTCHLKHNCVAQWVQHLRYICEYLRFPLPIFSHITIISSYAFISDMFILFSLNISPYLFQLHLIIVTSTISKHSSKRFSPDFLWDLLVTISYFIFVAHSSGLAYMKKFLRLPWPTFS